jgi:hypothetical protein
VLSIRVCSRYLLSCSSIVFNLAIKVYAQRVLYTGLINYASPRYIVRLNVILSTIFGDITSSKSSNPFSCVYMLSPFSKREKEKETRCFGANFLQPNANRSKKILHVFGPKIC